MKSISYAIGAIALATLLIGGCSSPASPEENARAYKQHLCAGQAEKARKLVEPVFFQFFGDADDGYFAPESQFFQAVEG